MKKELVKVSKFISLILRHDPHQVDINLDENGGWVDVNELIEAVNRKGMKLDRETLEYLVKNNTKQRLSFNDDGKRIRANYGHSLPVLLDLEPVIPPKRLYHGTATRFIKSIQEKGIIPQSRIYVHLSEDIETAKIVAIRHGKPAILNIKSAEMSEAGMKFYKAANGIWLTKNVPVEYILFPVL